MVFLISKLGRQFPVLGVKIRQRTRSQLMLPGKKCVLSGKHSSIISFETNFTKQPSKLYDARIEQYLKSKQPQPFRSGFECKNVLVKSFLHPLQAKMQELRELLILFKQGYYRCPLANRKLVKTKHRISAMLRIYPPDVSLIKLFKSQQFPSTVLLFISPLHKQKKPKGSGTHLWRLDTLFMS